MKIGVIDYKITEVSGLKDGNIDLNGHIIYNDMEIKLEKSLAPIPKAITLLHEILHGIIIQSGWKHNELLIEMLSYNLYQVLKDNHKEIMGYIEGEVK